MFLRKFLFLRDHQSVALGFCLLLVSQLVLGKVEPGTERRRYESAFENLFKKGGDAVVQLANFHMATKDIKDLQRNTGEAMALVKANADKVAIGLGVVASSWLLYQSIVLGNEIEMFFDDIDELKGQFHSYYFMKVPRLEELYHKAREIAGTDDPVGQREYFRTLFKELMKYHQELETILDKVDDIITDINKGCNDAVKNSALSGTIAVLAGIAFVTGGPVALSPVMWKGGLAVTMGFSGISVGLSLKNARDLQMISKKLVILKLDLRKLKNHVMSKVIEIISFV